VKNIVLAILLIVSWSIPTFADDSPKPPSHDELVEWATNGNVPSMVALGDNFRTATNVERDFTKSLEWYEKAAAQNDINGTYWAAMLHRDLAKPAGNEKAINYFKQTIALCALPDANCNQWTIWKELGLAERKAARYQDAITSNKRALEMIASSETTDIIANGGLLEELGIISDSLSQFEQAIIYFDLAEPIYERLAGTESLEVAGLWLGKGNALESLNRFDEAIAIEKKSLALHEKLNLGDSFQAAALLNNIGWSLKGKGDYPQSYDYFERSLPMLTKWVGPTADTIAYVYTNMGIVREKQGRHKEAIGLNMRGLAIMSKLPDITLEPKRWTLQSLANSYKALGNRKNAILFAKMAVNTQQEIRAQNVGLAEDQAKSLTEQWKPLYTDLADLLIDDGRPSEAQYVLNLVKQQELIEFVRRDSTANTALGGTALSKAETSQNDQLTALMDRPMKLAAELQVLTEKELAGTLTPEETNQIKKLNAELDSSYENFVTEVDTLLAAAETQGAGVAEDVSSLNLSYAADTQEQLKAFERPTVILQAASFDNGLHLFLTTKDASIHREVKINRAELSRKVFETIAAIESRDIEVDVKLAELYTLLVKPLAQDLKDSKAETIMLNLGGFLRYLPFAALKSDHGYLIEDYALSLYTPAAQTKFAAASHDKSSSAGFGVTAAHTGFNPLPGVAKEMEAIFEGSDAVGKLSGAASLDAAFTEDALRNALKKKPKLLHVASHFKFVPGNERDSFLLLGNGEPLSLEKIRKGRGFRFGGVDLITLSACETAKGSDAEGDEVESFGALAQMNGASAVMATLWPISDDASGPFMADFYAGLVESGLSKADALRRAQLAMVQGIEASNVSLINRAAGSEDGEPAASPAPQFTTLRHPYYWAPFIIMGNWM
jgi:CHAT domain-containing protein